MTSRIHDSRSAGRADHVDGNPDGGAVKTPGSAGKAYETLCVAVRDAALGIAHLHRESFPGLVEHLEDTVITVERPDRPRYGYFASCAWRHDDRSIHQI